MSDLRRWSEEGATVEEIALLGEARAERAPEAARAATLAALGIGAPPPSGGAPGGAAPGGASALSLLKVAAVALAVGGATLAAISFSRSRGEPETATATATELRVAVAEPESPGGPPAGPPPTGAAPAVGGAPGATSVRGPRPPRPHRAPATAPRPQPAVAEPTLADEVAALEEAERALATRAPAKALRALERYRAQFPRGKLAAEEMVLRVRALVAIGEVAEARAHAEAFCTAHPDSPYAGRLRALVTIPSPTPTEAP